MLAARRPTTWPVAATSRSSQLTAEISEVPRDMRGAHVWEFEDKFLTNFAESPQSLRDLSIRRMDAEISRRVQTVLTEAIPTGSPYYLATPGLSKPGVDAALAAVQDASDSGDVAIVGRPTMTRQIMDFDGYGNETMEEIRQGRPGSVPGRADRRAAQLQGRWRDGCPASLCTADRRLRRGVPPDAVEGTRRRARAHDVRRRHRHLPRPAVGAVATLGRPGVARSGPAGVVPWSLAHRVLAESVGVSGATST